ncbi:MNIO family bufferin maturase [Leptothrix sp. BB-4]
MPMNTHESDICLPRAAGIGLKHGHATELLAMRADIGFLEVHAENYLVDGGPLHHALTRVCERHPISIHGVGLSIGGAGPLDDDHLDRLAALLARYQPAAFSEHLAWSSHGHHHYNDLLPLPYDGENLRRVCAHVDQVQTRLRRRILLENPSTYVEFAVSTMDEPGFLAEVVRRTGCGLLLDVNNLHVSCTNHGRDARRELARLPLQAVGQVHLAGHAVEHDSLGAPLLIDDHGSPVAEPVWSLYGELLDRIGPVPTLIERDNDVPPLPVLLAEAAHAERLLRSLEGVAA